MQRLHSIPQNNFPTLGLTSPTILKVAFNDENGQIFAQSSYYLFQRDDKGFEYVVD